MSSPERNRRMRRRRAKRRRKLLLFACMGLLAGGLLFGLRGEGYSNVKTTGQVKIEVREPESERLREEEGLSGEQVWVQPGETVQRDPTIVVKEGSRPACLRVKILITGLNARLTDQLEEGICLCCGWQKNEKDGYYYYGNVVKEGEAVTVFSGIEVPESWGRLDEEPYFRVDIQAEAVEYGYQYISVSGWQSLFRDVED